MNRRLPVTPRTDVRPHAAATPQKSPPKWLECGRTQSARCSVASCCSGKPTKHRPPFRPLLTAPLERKKTILPRMIGLKKFSLPSQHTTSADERSSRERETGTARQSVTASRGRLSALLVFVAAQRISHAFARCRPTRFAFRHLGNQTVRGCCPERNRPPKDRVPHLPNI